MKLTGHLHAKVFAEIRVLQIDRRFRDLRRASVLLSIKEHGKDAKQIRAWVGDIVTLDIDLDIT